MNLDNLANLGIIAINPIQPSHKIDPKLQGYNFPDWAIKNNMLSIKILLYKNANLLF